MMTKRTGFQRDLTKKDLIKILEKIDSERNTETLRDYSSIEEGPGEEAFRRGRTKFSSNYEV